MNKYVLIYTGLPGEDADPATILDAWRGWFAELGEAVHPGHPFAAGWSVSQDGSVHDGAPHGLTGYSILTAESADAATEMVRGCPGLENAAIEVYEAAPFG